MLKKMEFFVSFKLCRVSQKPLDFKNICNFRTLVDLFPRSTFSTLVLSDDNNLDTSGCRCNFLPRNFKRDNKLPKILNVLTS